MHYGHVRHVSHCDQIRNAVCGAALGLVLFVAAFPLLWWNEGVAVKTARSLDEGLALVLSVRPEVVDGSNEGRLVHVVGPVSDVPLLVDSGLGVAVRGVQLQRQVEMYQWHESERKHRRRNVDGSETEYTSYSYSTRWSSRLEGNHFAEPGYSNPSSWPVSPVSSSAPSASLGAFRLTHTQIDQLSATRPVPLDELSLERMQQTIADTPREAQLQLPVSDQLLVGGGLADGFGDDDSVFEGGFDDEHPRGGRHRRGRGRRDRGRVARGGRGRAARRAVQRAARGTEASLAALDAGLEPRGGALYSGDPARPEVGDVRVSYKAAAPATMSVVGVQRGERIVPFRASSGGQVSLVEEGSVSAETMFHNAQTANTIRTWAIRAGGFFLMFVGISMSLNPLSTALRIVPLLGPMFGWIAEAGVCLAAVGIALPLSLITVAAAWVAYRPFLATVILGAALIPVLGLHKHIQARTATGPREAHQPS